MHLHRNRSVTRGEVVALNIEGDRRLARTGGPAGIAVTAEAARAGMRCLLIDEAPTLGGQIYRQLPRELSVRDPRELGRDHHRGERLRAELAQVADRVEVRSSCASWPAARRSTATSRPSGASTSR
jgi:NADPH-dependent 2,4-dienoyl-CoA reductase/sulfur reductase-like enzyme